MYWDDALTRYDFGPSHPMNPIRIDLLMRLAEAMGVLAAVEVVPPTSATAAELGRVHTTAILVAVRQCSVPDSGGAVAHGIGTPDAPART